MYSSYNPIFIIIVVILILVILYLLFFKNQTEPFTEKNNKKFKVTFVIPWGKKGTDAIVNYPKPPLEAPHTGNLLLIQHDSKYHLFKLGEKASEGVANSAMFGENDTLISELDPSYKIQSHEVLKTPNKHTFKIIEHSPKNKYLSFITMIAPSPDWFTAASSIDLSALGKKLEVGKHTVVPLFVYNAGTDAGNEFKTFPKNPQEPKPISIITHGPLFPKKQKATPPIALLDIERVA